MREQNVTSVIRIYLLCLQTGLIAAGPGAQYRMQVSNMFTVNFMFCPSKANSCRFKSISCDRNEPLQYINMWQITEVSNSMRRHADNSGNHADLWPIKICHSTILRLNSIWNSSLFQSMKCPSWTQVNRQKWSSDRTENGKCTNVTNRRSPVWLLP